MRPIKRLEIIVASPDLPEVIDLLEEVKVSGYTVIKDVQGKGDRGIQDGDGLTNVFQNSYVLIACDEAQFEQLKMPIKDLIEEIGGVCLVSEAQWLIR